MKNKEEKLYELSKELFIRKSVADFLTDKTESGFKSAMQNSMRVAQLFIEEFENFHKKDERS